MFKDLEDYMRNQSFSVNKVRKPIIFKDLLEYQSIILYHR
ncbi:unnamed protein product [Paramecium pentaurelia]|uniref:Uncharacterized protein n=1 Tax=Paramecium pentaurelia TaxID=43138 RepID=A0A8S1XVH6_9CILI|nr:unnamed protein product [Paramecium pentaurelia]